MKAVFLSLILVSLSSQVFAESVLDCNPIVSVAKSASGSGEEVPVLIGFASLSSIDSAPESFVGKIITTIVGGNIESSQIESVRPYATEIEDGVETALVMVKIEHNLNIKVTNKSPWLSCKILESGGI